LAGGEHERWALAPSGGGNGGGSTRWRAEGEQAAFICGLGRPWVTRDDGGDARRATAATSPTDRRSVACARTAALRRGLGAPRAGRRVGGRVGSGRARLII
jgi:hypothetical protein